jgi:hypothetical protein
MYIQTAYMAGIITISLAIGICRFLTAMHLTFIIHLSFFIDKAVNR